MPQPLDSEFASFYERISLTKAKADQLLTSRSALEKRISSWFSENQADYTLEFILQGSFATDTTVEPLQGEYDIDIGVHLSNDDIPLLQEDWVRAGTVQGWIYKAVDGHTQQKPQNKNKCVRVMYADGTNYHVDLPAYMNSRFSIPHFADAKEDWTESRPADFVKQVESAVSTRGEQLRRVIKYLKAWRDYQNRNERRVPSGVALTVLALDRFTTASSDTESLRQTAAGILSRLQTNTSIAMLVPPWDDLLADFPVEKFVAALDALVKAAREADDSNTPAQAVARWQKVLGTRLVPETKNTTSVSLAGLSFPDRPITPKKPRGYA